MGLHEDVKKLDLTVQLSICNFWNGQTCENVFKFLNSVDDDDDVKADNIFLDEAEDIELETLDWTAAQDEHEMLQIDKYFYVYNKLLCCPID